MVRRLLDSKMISTAEASRILEKLKDEGFGEFQRRTLQYAQNFSKTKPSHAEKAAREIAQKFQLDTKDAIQIVNCMPLTIEELRTIMAVKGRVIATSQIEGILKVLDAHR